MTPPRRPQPGEPGSRAKLTTAAVFPRYYSPDNLVVQRDGSILATAAPHQEPWYIPPADTRGPAEPILVHTFDQLTSGLVDTQPDAFCLSTSDGPARESFLRRLDLRHWNPGFIAGSIMADDLCLDEDAGVAYLTKHQQNAIERVPLRADGSAGQIVAGEPFHEQLVGPCSAAWGRRPGDYGRAAYVTTDGGLVAPPADDIVRPARLLRAELPAAEHAPDVPPGLTRSRPVDGNQNPNSVSEPDNLCAVVSGCAGFLVNGDLTANRSAQPMEGN
jgi:hypothetical protein